MSIRRISPGPRMSRAVVHGDTIYLAGHVHPDISVGVKGQTRAILERIEQVLAEAGSDKSRILSVQVWLADITTFEQMNEVYDVWVDSASSLSEPAALSNTSIFTTLSRAWSPNDSSFFIQPMTTEILSIVPAGVSSAIHCPLLFCSGSTIQQVSSLLSSAEAAFQ